MTLAFSFGSYGLIRHVGAPALHSLTVETATLLIPSLVYLGFLAADGRSSFGHSGAAQAVLLVGAGVVTAVPLFFAGAARRLPLVTLGLLQYVTPVMQFAFGVLVFHEPMPALRLMGFALVWVALIVLSVDMVRYQRTAREVQRQQGVEISNDITRSRYLGIGTSAGSGPAHDKHVATSVVIPQWPRGGGRGRRRRSRARDAARRCRCS